MAMLDKKEKYMEPLVTVAIAAYNVEKYLNTGIQYILDQTYKNIEIILVDDGSTDATPKLCDILAEKDSRIHVFHKENGGLGSARNVGIDQAKGKYLYFFDVDDSLEKDFIADSVKIAEEKKVDLIIFSYWAKFSDEITEEEIKIQEQEIHSNEELKKIYIQELLWLKHGNGFAWNKFYNISFLKKYKFHFGNQRIQQDEPFNMQLYPKLENVYLCSRAYYHYVLYVNSNAGSRYILNKENVIKDVYSKFMKFYRTWNIDDEKVLEYIRTRFVKGMFGVITGNYYHPQCSFSNRERRKKIQEIFSDSQLIECQKVVNVSFGKNPVNQLQGWAFMHRKTRLVMCMTSMKQILKKFYN